MSGTVGNDKPVESSVQEGYCKRFGNFMSRQVTALKEAYHDVGTQASTHCVAKRVAWFAGGFLLLCVCAFSVFVHAYGWMHFDSHDKVGWAIAAGVSTGIVIVPALTILGIMFALRIMITAIRFGAVNNLQAPNLNEQPQL